MSKYLKNTAYLLIFLSLCCWHIIKFIFKLAAIYWNEISFKYMIGITLLLFNKVTASLTPIFNVSSSSNRILNLHERNNGKLGHRFKLIYLTHCIIHFVQGILFWFQIKLLNEFTGKLVFNILCWFTSGYLGFVLVTFLNYKSFEFVAVMNTLPNLNIHMINPKFSVNSSVIIKIILINSYICILFSSLLYAGFMWTNPEPISYSTKNYVIATYGIRAYSVFRIFMVLYVSWDFIWVIILFSFVVLIGLFTCYYTIYKQSEQSIPLDKIGIAFSPKVFYKLVANYNRLKLFVGLTNDCFQDLIAFPIKIALMFVGVGDVLILIHQRFRSTAETFVLMFALYAAINIYLIMIFGYTFPGQVNVRSRKLKKSWICWMSKNQKCRHRVLEFRRIIRASMDLRIGLGSSNYYKRITALELVNFLLEKTVSLSLLMP